MEQSQNIKIISSLVIVLIILGIGYLLIGQYRVPGEDNEQAPGSSNQEPMEVVVESTPMTNGVLSVPAGFPQEIPLEKGAILESATTHYPGENAEQLSVSYHSSRTVAQKYTEYKNYMNKAGYRLTEGSTNAPVRAIFGAKKNINLSVALSTVKGQTLVQLSYLLTPL